MAVFVCILVLWVFSVCLHEYAHARVALAGGDVTVKDKGYLEFNPLRYTDPILSIVFPIIMLIAGNIGLPGGSVWINRSLLRSRGWETAMSLAGPATNLGLAILLGILFRMGVLPYDPNNTLGVTMAFFGFLQVMAFVFNLLPLPGFDGFNALLPWTPLGFREIVMRLPPMTSMLILLLLWRTDYVSKPLSFVGGVIMIVLGIDPEMAFQGLREFQFWH